MKKKFNKFGQLMVLKIYGLYREDEDHITDEWNGLILLFFFKQIK